MIPDWNMSGVLPPIRPNAPGHDPDRSPYMVELHKVVTRFGTSPERIAILEGLLRYRAALHAIGLTSGFQWLDGSFMEHIEILESRTPRDVDVVTFFDMPPATDEEEILNRNPNLFDHGWVKETYKADSYLLPLGSPLTVEYVKTISYWYSMWSHRRDTLWKGFIQISLSPEEDTEASTALETIRQ